MKLISKLVMAGSICCILSLGAQSQVVINIQTDSVINKMAAGFGANAFTVQLSCF